MAPSSPAKKRLSNTSSTRLRPIAEGNDAPDAPPIPLKSILRNSASASSLALSRDVPVTPTTPSRSWLDSRVSVNTSRTAPPAYEWVSAPGPSDAETLDNGPVEGEKLAALRRAGGYQRNQRGGWKRFILFGIVALIVIGLAVGLGVGLTVGRQKSGSSTLSAASGSDNTTNSEAFPLGEYSITTMLRTVRTNCTSNSATWSCFPYNTFDISDPDSASKSVATFNWVLSNSSSQYATTDSGPTSVDEVPANLTISSTNNPFGISFANQTLTYISPSLNSTSRRLAFSFSMAKSVFPSTSLSSDNTATECFFNQTTFTGTLFLSAPANLANGSTGSSSSNSSYPQWPYAVEVAQSSAGGENTPACYEYSNGAIGNRTTGLTPQAQDALCLCDYRNF